jgi:hypothetical protein
VNRTPTFIVERPPGLPQRVDQARPGVVHRRSTRPSVTDVKRNRLLLAAAALVATVVIVVVLIVVAPASDSKNSPRPAQAACRRSAQRGDALGKRTRLSRSLSSRTRSARSAGRGLSTLRRWSIATFEPGA